MKSENENLIIKDLNDLEEDGFSSAKAPWLDSRGQLKTDSELKRTSQSWNAETWEKFLNRTVDVEMTEVSLSAAEFDLLTAADPSEVWNTENSEAYTPTEQTAVRRSLRALTAQQYRVIKLIYWRDFGVRETARFMQVSRNLVSRQKWNSLRKLKRLSQKYMDTPTISEGVVSFKSRKIRRRPPSARIFEK